MLQARSLFFGLVVVLVSLSAIARADGPQWAWAGDYTVTEGTPCQGSVYPPKAYAHWQPNSWTSNDIYTGVQEVYISVHNCPRDYGCKSCINSKTGRRFPPVTEGGGSISTTTTTTQTVGGNISGGWTNLTIGANGSYSWTTSITESRNYGAKTATCPAYYNLWKKQHKLYQKETQYMEPAICDGTWRAAGAADGAPPSFTYTGDKTKYYYSLEWSANVGCPQ